MKFPSVPSVPNGSSTLAWRTQIVVQLQGSRVGWCSHAQRRHACALAGTYVVLSPTQGMSLGCACHSSTKRHVWYATPDKASTKMKWTKTMDQMTCREWSARPMRPTPLPHDVSVLLWGKGDDASTTSMGVPREGDEEHEKGDGNGRVAPPGPVKRQVSGWGAMDALM